jgi:hypothetical protein
LVEETGPLSSAIENGVGFSDYPVMSAECGKVFSAAGKMVITSRNKLEAEVIGICQILRSWYLAGVIKEAADVDLAPLESEEEFEMGTAITRTMK